MATKAAVSALALLAASFAGAVPPPPMGSRSGPATICGARFAVRLARGERAEQYQGDWWVVTGPGYQFGTRSDLGRLDAPTTRVAVPGFPSGERQRVREYPGDSWWGWTYAFPLPDGVTLRIASAQFQGNDGDFARLRRVLIGRQRNALCLPRR